MLRAIWLWARPLLAVGASGVALLAARALI